MTEFKKYLEVHRKHIVFNGDTLKLFYQPKKAGQSGTELYIKLYTYLFNNKLSTTTSDKDFYVSNKGLQAVFNMYGNNYCSKTIQRSLKILERLKLISFAYKKDRLDLVECLEKGEFVPRRIININLDLAKELFNIYEPKSDSFIVKYATTLAKNEVAECITPEEKDSLFKRLYSYFRKQLVKIASKRPFNYTEKANDKYEEYRKEGIVKGKYSTFKQMISWFQLIIARKYSKHNLFKKFIPQHLKDKQKEFDRLLKERAKATAKISKHTVGEFETL